MLYRILTSIHFIKVQAHSRNSHFLLPPPYNTQDPSFHLPYHSEHRITANLNPSIHIRHLPPTSNTVQHPIVTWPTPCAIKRISFNLEADHQVYDTPTFSATEITDLQYARLLRHSSQMIRFSLPSATTAPYSAVMHKTRI